MGVTHECDWPPEALVRPVLTRSAHAMGGASSRGIHELVSASVHGGASLYELDEDALEAAAPDLILTQELCAVCAVSYREVNEAVRAIDADIRVVSLEPTTIEGILHTITTIGAMTEAEDAAIDLVEELRERIVDVEQRVLARRDEGIEGPRVVAVEWLDPPFAVGHWVPQQIRSAGGWELLGQEGGRSVETTWQAIREVDPDLLLLMPCGYHLEGTLGEWRRVPRPPFWHELTAVRDGRVVALDGSSYFSRPGPRVVDGIELLAGIFDPAAFVDSGPAGSWAPAIDQR